MGECAQVRAWVADDGGRRGGSAERRAVVLAALQQGPPASPGPQIFFIGASCPYERCLEAWVWVRVRVGDLGERRWGREGGVEEKGGD